MSELAEDGVLAFEEGAPARAAADRRRGCQEGARELAGGQLSQPGGIAIARNGQIFVTDQMFTETGAGCCASGDPPPGSSRRLACEPVFAEHRSPRVLGIDPGLTRCGYAVVDGGGPGTATAVAFGVIRTPATDDVPSRLAALRGELAALIAEYRPTVVAVEQVFFQVNVRTAMSVGQASGLALAEAAAAGCTVVQYSPNQVKDAVAGWGGATKGQVQKMVQTRLRLAQPPRPADAADAAALALCYLAMAPLYQRIAAAGTR